jgi:hypothetical protein
MEMLRTASDLSEASLEDAVEQIGGVSIPHVTACTQDKYVVQRLVSRIGWSWSIDEDLPANAWKVKVNGKTVYSSGV